MKNDPIAQQQFSIRLSLTIGILMLVGKMYAYLITNSAAILSDAAESVVHVAAVAFAAYSMWLSVRPADATHQYGHDKIGFFSAGVEGFLIVVAACYILYESISSWVHGLQLERLDTGILFVAGAAVLNAGLGGYLVWQGRRHRSLILIANGKHVLTDFWTSAGVIVGLLLVMITGWQPFDPILAILVAVNILWSGGKLVRQSVGGLMDERNPELDKKLRSLLDEETKKRGLQYHELKHRESGRAIWVQFHLLFPRNTTIDEAHWQATEIEAIITANSDLPVHLSTHLEPAEEHEEVHYKLKDASE